VDRRVTRAQLLEAVRAQRDEIVRLTLELSNLPDRSEHERPVAEAVAAWLEGHGVRTELQDLGPESANVIGRIPGSRAGAPNLLVTAHLDTEGAVGDWNEQDARELRGAWQDGDLLIGKGVVNCKAQVAALMVASVTARDLAGPLGAELILVGMAQETGRVEGDIAGPHVMENHGARELVASGLRPDLALVGEPNDFAIAGAQAGYARVRVDVPGLIPYTPFVVRSGPRVLENPFERAGAVIGRLEHWCADYQERARSTFWGGTIVGTAQIQDVRGSGPLFSERTDWCRISLDVRTLPETDPESIADEIRSLLGDLPYACVVSLYDRDIGHVATGAERLVEALRDAHREVFGADPAPPTPSKVSMSQDMNVFNAAGIPSVAYGIKPVAEPYTRERFRAARIDDIVAMTSVYALAIERLCGRLESG
jgi:acetylornithine deacetylase/succinyl-diaminopimelate desuccinylase-like protein